jgi:IclR family pca regulon transcriptional regulator
LPGRILAPLIAAAPVRAVEFNHDAMWNLLSRWGFHFPCVTAGSGATMNQHITSRAADDSAEQPDFVTALARGLSVVRAFGSDDGPATLAEIARRVGLPRATVRRSLITLEALGYVETDGKTFTLTPKVLSLSYPYLNSIPLARSSKACLQDISRTLNESSGAAILDGNEVILLLRMSTLHAINPGVPLGSRSPAYCTSTGRVLLAGEPDCVIEEYLAHLKPEAFTPRTETDIAKIREAIFAARSHGYALLDEQTQIGIRAISVPVENAQHRVVAAINVVAPANRVTADEMVGRFLPLMRKKARELGAVLN